MLRSAGVAAVLAVLLAGCGQSPPLPPPLTAPDDVVLGTAVTDDSAALENQAYQDILTRDFGSITPDTAFKWGVLHPGPDQYVWQRADEALRRARQHNQRVRGHALLWHGSLPGWVASRATSCAAARDMLKEHIDAVAGRYRGQVWQWDVANEVLQPDGQLRRENPLLEVCGEVIIADAFRWAYQADPDAKLYLNDYATLESGPKAQTQLALMRRLLDDGVPIHGVGFQSHLELSTGVPDRAAEQLTAYGRLGLEVMITEADVRMPAAAAGRDALERQATIYADLVGLCLAQEACVGFTFWGFTDRWSWVPQVLPGEGRACLLDDQFVARPAWQAVREALQDR